MNWFKNMIIRWVREDWDNSSSKQREEDIYSTRPMAISRKGGLGSSVLDSDATLTFTIYNAIGGKVVEFRRYDRRTDQSDHSVYVVGKDEDFGEKIAKISTLEVMK